MVLAATDRVQLIEMPDLPSSLLGTIGSLIGAQAQPSVSILDVPGVKPHVKAIPTSVLVDPSAAQARLPYDITW